MAPPDDPRTLRARAEKAKAKGRHAQALECYLALERLEPDDGVWPHRSGEALRALGRAPEAVDAFVRAAERYGGAGFLVKAIAVAKVGQRLDPENPAVRAVLDWLVREQTGETGSTAFVVVETAAGPDESGEVLSLVESVPGAELDPAGPPDSGVYLLPVDLLTPEQTREELARTPVLSSLSGPALGRLVGRLRVLELEPGEEAFREGDPAEELFVVSEGRLEVVAESPLPTRLAVLEEGAFFGEIGVLCGVARTATVRALVGSRLLAIGRPALLEAIGEAPEVLPALLRVVRRRLVERLVETNRLFGPFSKRDRHELAGRFELLEAEDGAEVVTGGAPGTGFFLILAGRLEVRRGGFEGGVLATLGPGQMFGEMSLLSGDRATASVVGCGPSLLLRMRPEPFRELVERDPWIRTFLGELAVERHFALSIEAGDGEGSRIGIF